jgi:xylose isomerase
LGSTVGIWYFAPGGGRFHDRNVSEMAIPQRLELAAEMAKYGVKGIQTHNLSEVNEENLHLYKKLEKEAGVRLVGLGPDSFRGKEREFGTLSNPDKAKREKAQKTILGALKLVKEAGATHIGLWPGNDGFLCPLGAVFYQMWDWFEGALAECLDEVPVVRIGLETKPYEPVPNNIYRTTGDGLLMARDVEAPVKNPVNRKLLRTGTALSVFSLRSATS